MKKFRGIVSVVSVVMMGIVLVLAGCSSGSGTDPVDNGNGNGGTMTTPKPSVDRFYFYKGDDADVDITPYWSFFGGYEGTIDSKDDNGTGADGTSTFLILTGTEAQPWAAGGWGPDDGSDQPREIDFSNYDTLVFSARVSATPVKAAAQNIKFGLEDTTGDANVPEIARPATGNLGTDWVQYEIPFSEFTGEDSTKTKTLKYVLPANNVEVHIDEVYLTKK